MGSASLNKKRGDKDKLYSLHKPDTLCIAKGKARKKYEVRSKASISVTLGSEIVVEAMSFKENVYDGHPGGGWKTGSRVNRRASRAMIAEVVYRRRTKIGATKILIPGTERGGSVDQTRQRRNASKSERVSKLSSIT